MIKIFRIFVRYFNKSKIYVFIRNLNIRKLSVNRRP